MSTEHSRRSALGRIFAWGALSALPIGGCQVESEEGGHVPGLDKVWGVHGIKEGRLHKPRAAAIDASGNLYLADLTDRILVGCL